MSTQRPSCDVIIKEDLASRRYKTSTVIKDGILEKWTNYLGAWRPRYFVVEPGVLKYTNAPGQSVKETFPLVQCSTRSCPNDPLRIEITHPSGVLYLRLPSLDEKKVWLDALLNARNIFQQQLKLALPSTASLSHADSTQTAVNIENAIKCDPAESQFPESFPSLEVLSEYEDEKSPMESLLKTCTSFRKSLQSADADLRKLQSLLLNFAGRAKDTQWKSDIKLVILRIIESLDYIKFASSRHLAASETLAADEEHQRRALQRNVRTLAKQNYLMRLKLKKLQETLSLQGQYESSIKKELEKSFFDANDLISDDEEYLTDRSEGSVTADEETLLTEDDTTTAAEAPFSQDDNKINEPIGIVEEEMFFDAEEEPTTHQESQALRSQEDLISPRKIRRRTELPKKRTEFKMSLWSILKDCVGKDLSRISLPVGFNEPTSFLQRLAEDFQYSNLLKQAVTFENSVKRLLYVTLFSISPFASTVGRTYKPFNPLLGETFELSHRGFDFIAEQVAHHPPITAYHASSDEFLSWGCLIVNNRFTGKSLEVSIPGTVHVVLNNTNNGLNDGGQKCEAANFAGSPDHYTYQRAKAIVNNVIFGKLSFELFGPVIVTNHTIGDFAYIEYVHHSWWRGETNAIRGLIFDACGVPRYRLGGCWSREIWIETITRGYESCIQVPAEKIEFCPQRFPCPSGSSTSNNTEFSLPKYHSRCPVDVNIRWEDLPTIPGSREVIWIPDSRPQSAERYYGFGEITMELNEISPDYDLSKGASMPCTDSRFRPDQRLLELGDIQAASLEKQRLEEKQRMRARAREASHNPYSPRWFSWGIDPITQQSTWVFNNEYWEVKKKRKFVNCDIF